MDIVKTSKFLSLILRHQPELIHLELDGCGWAVVDELIDKINNYHNNQEKLTREHLDAVVDQNNKKRFAYSEDGKRIRASQGHSINIDLNLQPSTPPYKLYHGTSADQIKSIIKDGLLKMNRQHVHLSDNTATAKNVGARHSRPVIFIVDTVSMINDNCKFYKSENGVWLVDYVHPKYLKLIK